ncbi:MAG: hypothetical protein AAGJ50_13520 [Pseudomonadota bacterium]
MGGHIRGFLPGDVMADSPDLRLQFKADFSAQGTIVEPGGAVRTFELRSSIPVTQGDNGDEPKGPDIPKDDE